MANKWRGYLIKNLITGGVMDATFIALDSFDSTPNQREELVADRDDNTRDLYRVTADGMKTTITFTTIDDLELEPKIALQEFFKSSMVDVKQRKCYLEYWNDEDNEYKQGYFYIPNITFTMSKISDDNIWYNGIQITLTEY